MKGTYTRVHVEKLNKMYQEGQLTKDEIMDMDGPGTGVTFSEAFNELILANGCEWGATAADRIVVIDNTIYEQDQYDKGNVAIVGGSK